MADHLHYPRLALAQSVLQMLEVGLSSALTLFAPRRMGKTEFLLKDLQPLASERGWRVFYFSFMEGDAGTAGQTFAAALSAFAQPESLFGKTLGKLVGGIQLKGSIGPATLETTPRAGKAAEPPTVSAAISRLAQQKKPVLLLLDEVQELARRPGNAGLVAALRTGLDQHKDQVKVIFTGSSQAGLRAMFGDARAPFFHFATMIDFPPLDQGFTRHFAGVFHEITRRTLDDSALWDAFVQLGRVPLHMRALVESLILNPGRTLAEALPERLALLADTGSYERQWRELSALDQLLLTGLAAGETSPYRQESRTQLAQALGVTSLSPSSVQTALRKLERRDIVTRDSTGWRLADPSFAEWLKGQE